MVTAGIYHVNIHTYIPGLTKNWLPDLIGTSCHHGAVIHKQKNHLPQRINREK